MTEITLLLYPANQIFAPEKEEVKRVLENANFPDEIKFRIEKRNPVYIPTTLEGRDICLKKELVGDGRLKTFINLTLEQLGMVYECFLFNFCEPLFLYLFSESLKTLKGTIPVFLLPFPPLFGTLGCTLIEADIPPCIFVWFQPHSENYPQLVHELCHALQFLLSCKTGHCSSENCAFNPEPKTARICDNCRKRLAEAISRGGGRDG